MISDEDLRRIAEYDYVQCGDASAMAKELQAYRKAFSEPPEAFITLRLPDFEGYGNARRLVDAKKYDPTADSYWSAGVKHAYITTPLYRKPTIPE